MPTENKKSTTKAAALSGATKAPAEKEPLKVTVVPGDGLTPEERASAEEANKPENADNRAASYEMPVEGVNQNQ